MRLTTAEAELLDTLARRDAGSLFPLGADREQNVAAYALALLGFAWTRRIEGITYIEITTQGRAALDARKDRAARVKDLPDAAHALILQGPAGSDRVLSDIEVAALAEHDASGLG